MPQREAHSSKRTIIEQHVQLYTYIGFLYANVFNTIMIINNEIGIIVYSRTVHRTTNECVLQYITHLIQLWADTRPDVKYIIYELKSELTRL